METCSDRAEPVHDIVAPTQAGLNRRLASRRPDPERRAIQADLQDLPAYRRLGCQAEVDTRYGASRPHRGRARIARIYYPQPSPGFGCAPVQLRKQSGLGGAVVDKSPVKVEMFRIEIREDGTVEDTAAYPLADERV